MSVTATTAVLSRPACADVLCETTAKNGEAVGISYERTTDGDYVTCGTARVVRSERRIRAAEDAGADWATATLLGTSGAI